MRKAKTNAQKPLDITDIGKGRRREIALLLKKLKSIQDNEIAAIGGVRRQTLVRDIDLGKKV